MNEVLTWFSTSNTLTRENYRIWLNEISLLASSNGVREYLHQEKIKTIKKSEISKDELKTI